MIFKNKWFQLCIAVTLGIVVVLLPRPEGTKFKITGDRDREFFQHVSRYFTLVPSEKENSEYTVEARNPGSQEATAAFLEKTASLTVNV